MRLGNGTIPRSRRRSPGLERLDRLEWKSGLTFESFGTSIGIRWNTPEVPEALEKFLPPGYRPAEFTETDHLLSVLVADETDPQRAAPYHRFYEGSERAARTRDLDELHVLLASSIDFLIAAHSPESLFVHAGVVGWQGRAVLIPARSFSGKTSLVAELVRHGATYYSDEYAVFDAEGRVHPYPRRLSVREPGRTVRRDVSEIGGAAGSEPLPLGHVLMTRYRPGAEWQPRALSPGEGVLALIDNTVQARQRPHDALAILSRAMASARAVRSPRGEASELAPRLLEWLSASA